MEWALNGCRPPLHLNNPAFHALAAECDSAFLQHLRDFFVVLSGFRVGYEGGSHLFVPESEKSILRYRLKYAARTFEPVRRSNLDLSGRLVKKGAVVSWHGYRFHVSKVRMGTCYPVFSPVDDRRFFDCESVQVVG